VPPLLRSFLSLQHTEPNWQPWELFRHVGVTPEVEGWLRADGSLTRRVVQHCPHRFRVRVLCQGWGRPTPAERCRLGMDRVRAALVREVQLLCGATPWVFARTLIPVTTLQGAARRLAYLRDKPLAAVLFADPRVRRRHMEMAELRPRHWLYHSAILSLNSAPPRLWGRRTLFYMAGRPLLVHEIFLPTLLS
jgi:chorismate--pyruvate lyase